MQDRSIDRSAYPIESPCPPARAQIRNQKERLLNMKAQITGVGHKASLMASQVGVCGMKVGVGMGKKLYLTRSIN